MGGIDRTAGKDMDMVRVQHQSGDLGCAVQSMGTTQVFWSVQPVGGRIQSQHAFGHELHPFHVADRGDMRIVIF